MDERESAAPSPAAPFEHSRIASGAQRGVAVNQSPASSEHLVPFARTPWAFWRWVGVRGAGFPVTLALALAAPGCAMAANHLAQREVAANVARTAAIRALEGELEGVDAQRRAEVIAAIRRVRAGKPPKPLTIPDAVNDTLSAYYQLAEEYRAATSNFRAQYDAATTQTSRTLHEIAQTNRFREAMIWQNREALHGSVTALLRRPPEAVSAETRKQRELVARYVQRYCAKNDTIGFFGPLGWARCVAEDVSLVLHPGPTLLATHHVAFENWGIDALGEALVADTSLAPWAIPRMMPFLSLEGTLLHLPFSKPIRIPLAQAAVLAACDGERTAHTIAATLIREPSSGLTSMADVYQQLGKLRTMRRIAWTYEVPVDARYPERELRRQLERIGEAPLRQVALERLDRLEAAGAAVADSTGDADRLDEAMGRLEATFTDLTAKAAVHNAGKIYAARTLIYEDCRRDIEMTLGLNILRELEHPLALLLTSARWLTHEVAASYRQAFTTAYRELAQRTNSSTVDFASFWPWVQPLLFESSGRPLDHLAPALYERWESILSLPAGQTRVTYRSTDIESRVFDVFAAPGPGWSPACYHSPDIMIDASDADAIRRNDYQFVLGELHLGRNTLDCEALIAQHPTIPELLDMTARDLPEPRVIPVMTHAFVPAKRNHPVLILAKDYRLIFGPDTCGVPAEQALPTGSLVIEEVGDTLVVRTRDGRLRFDILELFGEVLSQQVVNCFRLLRPAPHTPRVTIDRLVVCRETWRVPPKELPFADLKDAADRFLAARAWARTQNLPRFVFVRTPIEEKPFYVDFDSLIYVDILAKAIRRAQEIGPDGGMITFSEMLPDPDHAWLPDADGARYTSELRFVAVDQLRVPQQRPDAMTRAATTSTSSAY